MRSLPTDEYFDKLERLRPYIFDYSENLIQQFEQFLSRPVINNIIPILEPTDGDIAESAYNTLLHVRRIRRISTVVMKEIESGFPIFTTGISTYTDAVNKYCQTIFMIRRHCFFNGINMENLCEYAVSWIFEQNVSPIMMSYIILNEHVGSPVDVMCYWYSVLFNNGREAEAQFLLKV